MTEEGKEHENPPIPEARTLLGDAVTNIENKQFLDGVTIANTAFVLATKENNNSLAAECLSLMASGYRHMYRDTGMKSFIIQAANIANSAVEVSGLSREKGATVIP